MTDGESGRNYGWRVTFAAMGINLALGILYSWSVISKAVPAEWGWTEKQKSWPYAIACLVFSIIMVPAGRIQDKFSPRVVAMVGGVLVGLGMILCSFMTSSAGFILGFGVLAGAGIGFGYASATPPAVKWFPAAKVGMIAGIVVSGFGLASVYAAPLTEYLIGRIGFQHTLMALGIAFLVVVVALAQLLQVPGKPLQFAKPLGAGGDTKSAAPALAKKEEFLPTEMLRTPQFYILWFMYFCGAGAGLMIISKLARLAQDLSKVQKTFIFVACLAVGNGAGRIIAGSLSDKLGRGRTMLICFVFQAALMLILAQATTGSPLGTVYALCLISILIGANYGANLALFPSVTKDYYGLKNFGVNYGLVFTAWGVGGFVLPMLAGWVKDTYKSFGYAYYISAGLLILAAVTTFLLKAPRHEETPAAA